jgi:hypothetical protein
MGGLLLASFLEAQMAQIRRRWTQIRGLGLLVSAGW